MQLSYHFLLLLSLYFANVGLAETISKETSRGPSSSSFLSSQESNTTQLPPPVTWDEQYFLRCFNPVQAFSGAWLATTGAFLDTKFDNNLFVEPACFNMAKRNRTILKTSNVIDFFVEHLSGFEHSTRQARKYLQQNFDAQYATSMVSDTAAEAATRSATFKTISHNFSTIAVIPFYGCIPTNQTKCVGFSSGTKASSAVHQDYLAATIFSTGALFHL